LTLLNATGRGPWVNPIARSVDGLWVVSQQKTPALHRLNTGSNLDGSMPKETAFTLISHNKARESNDLFINIVAHIHHFANSSMNLLLCLFQISVDCKIYRWLA
jgi:hypothetical protein